jgi:hypothetical protein
MLALGSQHRMHRLNSSHPIHQEKIKGGFASAKLLFIFVFIEAQDHEQ